MIRLVLLPGLDGTGELFAGFVAALDERFVPLVVSYPTHEPLDYVALERLVRERLPGGDFMLLAESFSGPLAISIAAHPPPGLRALVLCCSFARTPWPALKPLRFLLRALPGWALRAWPARRLLLGRGSSPALSTGVTRAVGRVAPAVLRQRLRAVANVDTRPLLARVQVPVIHLSATGDRIVPRRVSVELARVLPAMRTMELAGPHLLLQARPHDCARVLAELLGS